VVGALLVVALTVVKAPGIRTVEASGVALGWWWIVRGAWLRTRAGRAVRSSEAPWAEPALSSRRAWWFTWLAAACATAAAIALSVQAVHWGG
jgi:hypothetical protein